MVIWTTPAKIDLKHIYNFIAEDSQQYARRVIKEIVEKAELLETTPRLGRVVPEISSQYIRELSLYSYRILYEIKDQQIEVLALVHKRRNLMPEDIER